MNDLVTMEQAREYGLREAKRRNKIAELYMREGKMAEAWENARMANALILLATDGKG